MSHNSTKQTKLGPSFVVYNINSTPTTVYFDEAEMEDTAFGSVKLAGKVVPKSNVLLLSLTP